MNHQCVCVSFNYSLANAVQLFSCSFAQSDNSIDKGLLPIRQGFDAYSFAEELNKKSKECSRIFEIFHTHSGMLHIYFPHEFVFHHESDAGIGIRKRIKIFAQFKIDQHS